MLGTRLFFMLMLVTVDALVLILIMTGLSEVEYGARIPGAVGTLALAIVCNLLAVYLFGGYVLRRQLSFIHIPAQMGAATGLASVMKRGKLFSRKKKKLPLHFLGEKSPDRTSEQGS